MFRWDEYIISVAIFDLSSEFLFRFADMAYRSFEGDSSKKSQRRSLSAPAERPARKARNSSVYKRISVQEFFEAPRIKAYMMSGQRVCLPGLGEGRDFGTFPNHYGIGAILDTPGWIKVLRTPED